jgi:uncharacterized protein YkwD
VPIHVVRPCRLLLTVVLAAVIALAAMPASRALAAAGKPTAHAAAHHHRHAVTPSPSAQASNSAACADTYLLPTAADLDRVAAATLCLINRERTTRGLRALRADPAMTGAAAAHSQDMVARRYFDHVTPTGQDPLQRLRTAGYVRPGRGFVVAENIAAASGSLASPAATVRMWMSSPAHRVNILDPAYRDTGIGVAAGAASLSPSGATYTEDFGTTS